MKISRREEQASTQPPFLPSFQITRIPHQPTQAHPKDLSPLAPNKPLSTPQIIRGVCPPSKQFPSFHTLRSHNMLQAHQRHQVICKCNVRQHNVCSMRMQKPKQSKAKNTVPNEERRSECYPKSSDLLSCKRCRTLQYSKVPP